MANTEKNRLCPRCHEYSPAIYFTGSKATTDRDIEICGTCGNAELGNLKKVADWPVDDDQVRASPFW